MKATYIKPLFEICLSDNEPAIMSISKWTPKNASDNGGSSISNSTGDISVDNNKNGDNVSFSKQAWDCWADDNEDDLY